MYTVEYLILVDNKKTSCTTVDALLHLLQSDSDISVLNNGKQVRYKDKNTFLLNVEKGTSKIDESPKSQNIYFDIQISCNKIGELQAFSALLRSIRKVVTSLLAAPTALQVLADDMSVHYSTKAYPIISETENRMRKLITKFMHINLGIAWLDSRIPDDVQKSINASNTDTTYLYNVDFIKLKDILLSESYSKDRDALIKELKNNQKDSFKREEIEPLIPISNWDKYFSKDVNFEATELSNLWTQLYDIRCKVAHNKTFSLDDLNRTKFLSAKLNPILDEAIMNLAGISVDENEVQEIVDDAVTKFSKFNDPNLNEFMNEYRMLSRLTYKLTTPLNRKKAAHRKFLHDVALMKSEDYISTADVDLVREVAATRNIFVHNISEAGDLERLIELTVELKNLNTKLNKISESKFPKNPIVPTQSSLQKVPPSHA